MFMDGVIVLGGEKVKESLDACAFYACVIVCVRGQSC